MMRTEPPYPGQLWKHGSVRNRRHGVDAEQQNEEGRHERAAAHAGHPN
jgi:hypothetical protein